MIPVGFLVGGMARMSVWIPDREGRHGGGEYGSVNVYICPLK